jgi:hypothetical protein
MRNGCTTLFAGAVPSLERQQWSRSTGRRDRREEGSASVLVSAARIVASAFIVLWLAAR